MDAPMGSGRRRRASDTRHARPAAVRQQRRGQKRARAIRRRKRAHALRQTAAVETQCAGNGRTHQPYGHGKHRIAQYGAGKIQRHADFRLPRPPVRLLARHPNHRIGRQRRV